VSAPAFVKFADNVAPFVAKACATFAAVAAPVAVIVNPSIVIESKLTILLKVIVDASVAPAKVVGAAPVANPANALATLSALEPDVDL
jgi:hypothetical protein